MALEGGLQLALILLLLDGHAEDVRGTLQKCDVMPLNSPSDRLWTSSTPNGEPSPCKMTFIARRCRVP